jgi:hypothetical protein
MVAIVVTMFYLLSNYCERYLSDQFMEGIYIFENRFTRIITVYAV